MAIRLDLLKDKFQLNLEKAGIFNVPVLETRTAIDVSSSIEPLFRSGMLADAIDRTIVAALKFDDNQSLEVGRFSDDFDFMEEATAEDVGVYLKKHRGFFTGGGTAYTPI